MGDDSSQTFGNHGYARRKSAINSRMTSTELVENLTVLTEGAGKRTTISRAEDPLEKDFVVPNSSISQGVVGRANHE